MKMNWFILALGAMVLFTITFLLIKKVGDLGLKSEVILFYYFAIGALIILVYIFMNKMSLQASGYIFVLLLIMALIGSIANILLFNSIKIAPNPGYALAVSGLHVLLVAVASIFIFKSEFTLLKGIGTILAIIGIIILGL